jgi:hypothetical protein
LDHLFVTPEAGAAANDRDTRDTAVLRPSAQDFKKPVVSANFIPAAFSDRALSVCGYLDSRFKGFGYEHAEHSARLVRAGFGGEMRMSERGELEPHYYLLSADLTVSTDDSYRDEKSLATNWATWERMYGDPAYRHPWRTTDEFRQFRREMRDAARTANFSLAQRLSLETRWRRWRRSPEAVSSAHL